jgi:hypothetical protein
MVLGHLHHGNPHAVGIFDPHLDESPGLPSGRPGDRHTDGGQPLVFTGDIPHLKPYFEPHGWLLGMTRDLEQAVAQEVDDAATLRWAELPIDGQAEDVAVEGM